MLGYDKTEVKAPKDVESRTISAGLAEGTSLLIRLS